MKDYKYTVDGEKVTLDQIVARCANIDRATLRRRINAGLRSWADLTRDKVEAARATRARLSGKAKR